MLSLGRRRQRQRGADEGAGGRTRALPLLLALLSCLIFACPAQASLTVLVGEPFGSFGTYLPVGHTTILLDRVCADGPLKLRMCEPGEPAGVAISRYNNLGRYDWMATPILQFLYGVDRPADILQDATAEQANELRQQYRHRVLGAIFPDGTEKLDGNSEWWESVAMAYMRRFWGYQLATTRDQDERFVATINARPNKHAYGAYHHNCANFAADVVSFYYPGLVKRARVADLGFLLPKQLARCVFLYGQAHPQAQMRIVEVPQVPGTIHRSHAVRGGAETFLKTKRYLVPLAVIQPEIVVTLLGCYLDHGGWKIARSAEMLGPEAVQPTQRILAGN